MKTSSGRSNKVYTLPARILKYYPENQTADITLCAEQVYSNYEGSLKNQKRIPILGVPVHTASGGGWALSFPIAVGDTCLVVFSQVGYDHWLYLDRDTGGTLLGQPSPQLRRSFNEDDGFVMVGFNTMPRVIQNVSPSDSEWRNTNKTQLISLKLDGSIEIKSDVQVTVNSDVTINGNVVVSGDVTASGISLVTHTHSGDSGGSTSAPS